MKDKEAFYACVLEWLKGKDTLAVEVTSANPYFIQYEDEDDVVQSEFEIRIKYKIKRDNDFTTTGVKVDKNTGVKESFSIDPEKGKIYKRSYVGQYEEVEDFLNHVINYAF